IDVHWPTAVIEQDIAAVQIAVLDAARHIDLKILDGRQVDGTEMMVVHLQRHVADQRPPNSRNAYPLNLARAMPSRLILSKPFNGRRGGSRIGRQLIEQRS